MNGQLVPFSSVRTCWFLPSGQINFWYVERTLLCLLVVTDVVSLKHGCWILLMSSYGISRSWFLEPRFQGRHHKYRVLNIDIHKDGRHLRISLIRALPSWASVIIWSLRSSDQAHPGVRVSLTNINSPFCDVKLWTLTLHTMAVRFLGSRVVHLYMPSMSRNYVLKKSPFGVQYFPNVQEQEFCYSHYFFFKSAAANQLVFLLMALWHISMELQKKSIRRTLLSSRTETTRKKEPLKSSSWY